MDDYEKFALIDLAKAWLAFIAGFLIGGIVCLYLFCWMFYGYTSSRHVCNYVAYVAVVIIPILLIACMVRQVRNEERSWPLTFVVGLLLGPVSMVLLYQLVTWLAINTGFCLPLQGWG